MVEQLFRALAEVPQIEAIALGGSRAGTHFDDSSDYDIYLYCTAPVGEEERRRILEPLCSYVEYGNHFWELEDNGTFKDGIDFDILYRDLDDLVTGVAWVVEGFHPSNAYTTCMWHNLITSQIVLDKDGKLHELQEKYKIPYPQKLKENIISNNLKLLNGMLPSFDMQIKKAENRADLVSVNHRVTEFLASYFDIIFALNEMTHPGEKRMQSICSAECNILPKHFDENLNKLFKGMFREHISDVISDIVAELQKIAQI